MVYGELCPDCLRSGCPDEELRAFGSRGDIAGNCLLEGIDRAEDAPLQALPRKPGEEPFDGVEP